VHLELVPIVGGDHNHYLEKIRNSVIFTHHQKLVICDDDTSLVGYIGGIDLTYGRWDHRGYPLFRTLTSEHKGDFHNGCANIPSGSEVGPRQPWHDIHQCVRGPAVLHLLKNFEERWQRQASSSVSKLVSLEQLGIDVDAIERNGNEWTTQLFRSIDERTARFDPEIVGRFEAQKFDDIKGVQFVGEGAELSSSTKNRQKMLQKVWRQRKEYERQFVSNSARGFDWMRTLDEKKGRKIDSSVHRAYVHYIRQAEHAIYMESQYFLSSSHLWPESNSIKCINLVAAEITWKICEKISSSERFAVYIVLPMWPEGLPESNSVQEILHWQHLTFEGMYKRIAQAIGRKKQDDDNFDAQVTDYLNFYCLATRETTEGSEATRAPREKSQEEVLHQSRRHLVYVHSKMMIVDDAVVLVGSANVNQRSLDGTRDTEISQACWQPGYCATKDSVPRGDVHGFRLHCWGHLMGCVDDSFRDPSSLDCVRRVNSIATENYECFINDEACDMTSSLVPYPISLSKDGTVEAKTINGQPYFPDTSAPILGKRSGMLPEYLTT